MNQTTQEKPFFSVITIHLNMMEGLKRTHASIQAQGFDNFEWIVIDGQSNDGSQAWLKTIGAAHCISQPDNGPYDAMNKGMECASGHYLIFLNAGDTLHDGTILQKIYDQTAQNNRPDFIYGDFYDDQFYRRAKHHTKITRGMITSHQAMIYRRKAIAKIRYDTIYKIAADYDFTVRFLAKTSRVLILQFPDMCF